MQFKHRLLLKVAVIIRASKLVKYCSINNDERATTPFKLVFFCGEKGLDYLNASLFSVYKHWKKLPEVCIISDGSPVENIEKGLLKWPRQIKVVSWQECALGFKEVGDINLYNYAANELLGKKFVGILHFAKQGPVLYSDSDILWHNSPTELDFNLGLKPQIRMSEDVAHFYTDGLLKALGEEKCLETTAFNSGVVFLNGEFSSYSKWKSLCEYLGTNKSIGWFTEQTSFAILKNHFRPEDFFKLNEILIKVDDEYSLKSTRKLYPNILARHYVNVKVTTFWRDFFYMVLFPKFSR